MRFSRPERGATVVEFAIAAPIFFLLLLGTFEFGRYYYVQHTIQFGTREGTRLALVGRTLNDEDGNPLSREDSIRRMIRDHVTPAVNPDEVLINIYPVESDYSDPGGWDQQSNPGNPGQYMRVRTRYTYRFITPFVGDFFPGGVNVIQAQSTYRNELFN